MHDIMETVSWIAFAIIAATLVILALRKHSPTMVLAISNCLIFIIGMIESGGFNATLLTEMGFRSDLSYFVNEPWTIITSMFAHVDPMHLIFNMLFLLVVGIPLESRIGKERFIAIYFIGGMIGTVVFAVTETMAGGHALLVGASGAISALMGAMLLLYPREKIMFFLGPLLTDRFTVRVPILVWFAIQLLLFTFDDSPVAYAAHLGGFVAGIGIAWLLRPGGTKSERKMTDGISSLKALCNTSALREMYDYAENAKDSVTRKIWVERILKDVACPECGAAVKRKGKGFVCTKGHKI